MYYGGLLNNFNSGSFRNDVSPNTVCMTCIWFGLWRMPLRWSFPPSVFVPRAHIMTSAFKSCKRGVFFIRERKIQIINYVCYHKKRSMGVC